MNDPTDIRWRQRLNQSADEILADVVNVFYPLFVAFEARMTRLAHES